MPERPTVLIVGDLALDITHRGVIERDSPEAPGVPVVRVVETTYAPGCAANTAANVATLGGRALLVGAIGDDADGARLGRLVRAAGVGAELIPVVGRATTIKRRVVADGRHVVRVDEEEDSPIDDARIASVSVGLITWATVVLVSDYNKGVVTEAICRAVIAEANSRGIPVIVDPKCPDWSRYAGAVCLTPNETEWAASGYDWPPGDAYMLVKQGAEGLTLYRRGFAPFHVPAELVEDPDPIGAGDSAVAALAVAIGRGASWEEGVRLANAAGAEACRHAGTVAVNLRAELTRAAPVR